MIMIKVLRCIIHGRPPTCPTPSIQCAMSIQCSYNTRRLLCYYVTTLQSARNMIFVIHAYIISTAHCKGCMGSQYSTVLHCSSCDAWEPNLTFFSSLTYCAAIICAVAIILIFMTPDHKNSKRFLTLTTAGNYNIYNGRYEAFFPKNFWFLVPAE